jgi:hypothetical protein
MPNGRYYLIIYMRRDSSAARDCPSVKIEASAADPSGPRGVVIAVPGHADRTLRAIWEARS